VKVLLAIDEEPDSEDGVPRPCPAEVVHAKDAMGEEDA
jgi:hypothetical protein